MVRMHCNREVTHLPGTGTHIRRMCDTCGQTFTQRVNGKNPPKRTVAPLTRQTEMIDLKTGKPVTV